MAGWTKFRDANDENCDDKCQGKCNRRAGSVKEKSTGHGKDHEDGMPGVLFDQAILVLLRRLYAKDAIKPIPVLLTGSQSVDLFRMFCLVREKGGFNSVSRGNLWGFVAKNLDLDFRFIASLKMLYFNKLGDLDQWLDSVGKDWNSMKMSDNCSRNLELLSIELEKRFRSLFVKDAKPVKRDKEIISAGCDQIRDHIVVALRQNWQSPGVKEDNKLLDDGNIAHTDDVEKIRENEADKSVGRPDTVFVKSDSNHKSGSNHKRKREGCEEMLSWLKKIAKNPCQLSEGGILNSSKWSQNSVKECRTLALLVRGAMLKRKYTKSNGNECCPHQKQKIDPSMYDDPASCHLPGIRFSKRVPALVRSPKCPCCTSPQTKESRMVNHSKVVEPENDPRYKEDKTPGSPASSCSSEPTDGSSPDKLLVENCVNVGPQFQAEIPQVTGESDCKWLGTRVWPPDNCEQKPVDVLPNDICNCPFPGSVECVRFHIMENNMKLKRELGRVFYRWGFDRIGEVVSLSWTPQEEEQFKSVVCMGKSSFLEKTRQELVEYYFNVFIPRKRSYQNRVTPNAIDSDDEFSDFGSVGGLYGHAATRISPS